MCACTACEPADVRINDDVLALFDDSRLASPYACPRHFDFHDTRSIIEKKGVWVLIDTHLPLDLSKRFHLPSSPFERHIVKRIVFRRLENLTDCHYLPGKHEGGAEAWQRQRHQNDQSCEHETWHRYVAFALSIRN